MTAAQAPAVESGDCWCGRPTAMGESARKADKYLTGVLFDRKGKKGGHPSDAHTL